MIKTIAFAFLFTSNLLAQESGYLTGEKYPNQSLSIEGPVSSKALVPTKDSFKRGFNILLPNITPSVYQESAGSCLFMAHTGVVEWWYKSLNPRLDKNQTDLSERLFMNLSKDKVGQSKIDNWRTDTIYRLNENGYMFTNKDFRFTKGHYKKIGKKRVKARATDPAAIYDTAFNWIVEYKQVNANKIKMPIFDRRVLYKDANKDQWAVGKAPWNSVERIKYALRKNKSPVIVIYNHLGFWHANMVVGYNEFASSDRCQFVSTYQEKMNKKASELEKKASETTSVVLKEKLLKKAAKHRTLGEKVQAKFTSIGGCKGKGVFYVRDSIYPQKNRALYDYDLTRKGEEEHYNAKVILREFEWIKVLSNHAIQIFPL